MLEQRFGIFLDVPFPVSDEEQLNFSSVRLISFNFDQPELKQLVSVFRPYLVLKDEDWPKGEGKICAFYHPQTRQLVHLCLGRIILDEVTEERLYLGLRYSPAESPFLRFDTWPVYHSALKELVPEDHRVTGSPVPIEGGTLLAFAQNFGVKGSL